MDIVTLDFETYYDKEYSLSKLTTEEYIRDDRFEIIGLAVKKNDKPTKPILRFPENGYVGGVCQGIGVYTSTPPIIWRIISVLGISGAIFIYPTLWIFLKKG